MNTYISAIDYYLPEQRVSTRDMMAETKPERLGFSDTLIEDMVGIYEVRHGASNEKPSTLATIAAKKMLENFEGNLDEIGLLIFCGIDRDYVEPSTAHVIQGNLGLKNAVCFDVSNACMGFMTGMQIANAAITSGMARHVLICTGERSSEVTKKAIQQLKNLPNREDFFNMIGALTVGDAGVAAIISSTNESMGLIALNFSSKGRLAELCHYKYVDGLPQGRMLMKEISSAMLKSHKRMFPETLKKIGEDTAAGDIKCLITHQVGKVPWKGFSKLLGVDQGSMTKTYDILGNITSATFGVNYAKALQSSQIRKGDLVMAAMAGSGLSVCQMAIVV
jgi:3-oxoacyl-[acyl-carrier-protein] synthase-3